MIKLEKTIMEVMKNTDNELVCSNMLAFFLNPLEEHKFNELILKALIKTLAKRGLIEEYSYNYQNIVVTREYQSIDIVILNDDYVIGIENKINADLYNDLSSYSNRLEAFNKKMINIVLSKKAINTNYNTTGFTNITYNELVEQIDKIMVNIKSKNTKWYFYLEDFVINLRNNNTEYQYKKELLKNGEIADTEINEINQEISNKIKQFVNIIEKKKNDNKKVKYNLEVNIDLTAYILLNGFNMDARLTPNGWTIGIFVYKNSKVPVIHKFFYEKDIKIIDSNNNHFILKEFDYNENIQNIVEYYLEMYNLIKNI